MTGKDKNIWIEGMLAATSPDIADKGFSSGVMAKIKAREKQRLMVLAPFFAAGLASLLTFFPYGALEKLSAPLNVDFATLLPGLMPILLFVAVTVLFTFSEEAR